MPEDIKERNESGSDNKPETKEFIKKSIRHDDDEENLTPFEKFVRLEMETKIGFIITLTFLLGLIFRWYWLNTSWWLVLILGIVGLKALYTQMNDLQDEKPDEAKIARYCFIALIAILVIRDLYITTEMAGYLSYPAIK